MVRVGSLAGSPSSDYRLIAGRVPWLARTLPAGFTRGKTTELTVYGSGLEAAQAVWLGDHIARCAILSRSAGAVRVSINVPVKAPLGAERLHVVAGGIEAPVPAPVVVGDVPEITVITNPATLAGALTVKAPVVVNGIVAKERASQYFSFHAEAGQRFEFRVDSMRLGYPLDPVVTLLDASGKRMAAADDPGIDERSDAYQLDPRLAYQFQQSGTYLVAVRDAMYRGDDAFVYRLSILPGGTDFGVEVREPVKTAYLGQKTELLLRVRRFGGWDAPVEIEAEGLPKGLLAEKVVAPPKDSVVKDTCGVERTIDGTIVNLPIRVGDVKPGLYHFIVKARGTRNARVTEHISRVDYERYATGYFFGPMQEQRIDLTVMAAPNVIFNTPEKMTLSPGHSGSIEISVGRYLNAAGATLIIDTKPLPAGLTVEPARLSGEVKQMKLKVTVAPDAQEGQIPVILYAHREGQAPLGESAPILLRIRHEASQ